ncbi:hypothetical protein CHLNCDRAFT_139725 [Chlorella variabilis]|uniref:Cwf18 pre-mRNA splicing factor n=1 Tax=Chlorella variabilis TaxID=554065 RepID=E1ZQT0_CHLVA|nr:hypothetical protein CHLNCDRAFT_139725 [Chlorella variabilis]EFN51770.1 hypothetical protein CHLNCDRAFT_139725 [Chlorella variabilis]|eukprot:XP_005843872.1 hypothetical protein CHLNCDRAFT_139725 [Chlorella variabilis]
MGEVAAAPQEPDGPKLRFRNYAVAAQEQIEHQRVEPARVPEFKEVKVDVAAVLGDDPEEVLVNVAPKKANWDLRRDIADKLARLERRTQAAMINLMQAERGEEGDANNKP